MPIRLLYPIRLVLPAVIATVGLLFVALTPAWAGDTDRGDSAPDRPKVGLVLSGGGARGAAHIGVIRVLEELRVPIDAIAGTSMGSIIGALYASGMDIDEIERAVNSIDWADAFDDDPPREKRRFRDKQEDRDFLVKSAPGYEDGELKFPSGLIQGQKVDLILSELTLPVAAVKDFDQLSVPYRAVATDIATGQAVVIGSGNLSVAMRASMSVPGGFSPVEFGDKLLVDGGVSNNVPVDVARDMGADVLIVVDISTPLTPKEKLNSVLAITDQLTSIMTRSNTERSLATLTERDTIIVPQLGDISTMDFGRAGDAVPLGEVAARQQADRLRTLSLSDKDYAMHLAARTTRWPAPPVIEFVRIDNRSRLDDAMLASRIRAQPGQPLDVEALEEDIGTIYALELFQAVTYELVEENGQTGLEISAVEKSWGPNYLQLGMQLQSDFEGSNSFNLATSYTRTGLTALGGEWKTILQIGEEPRIFSDVYLPLDIDSRYFFNPFVEYQKTNVNVFSGEDKLAEYRVDAIGFGLEGGRNLGEWGEFRTGWRLATGEADVLVGDPALPDIDFDVGNIFARLSWDTYDNLYFPHSGQLGRIEWAAFRDAFGDDQNLDQVELSAGVALGRGRDSLVLAGRVDTTLDEDASVENLFRLGGFLNLSGYDVNELSGQHSAVAAAIYFRRVNDFHLLPAYLGASLEAGNTWNDRDEIDFDNVLLAGSLFFGVDSPIGPLYTGYGYGEGGRSSVFMFLGSPF